MSQRPLSRPRPLYATCDHGVESILAHELTRLGAQNVEPHHRGVHFWGNEEVIWRTNLFTRTANRILLPLTTFEASDQKELYAGSKKVRWDWWLHTSQTMAVDASSHKSDLSHTHYIAQVVKDGVVDAFRDRFEQRPNVDIEDPDLPINARLVENLCTLNLDTSGHRLHKRGYRLDGGSAPIKETLAAALTHCAQWKPYEPLVDLTCGSGTLIIEAALRARFVPAGLHRAQHEGFAFQRWRSHAPSKFTHWLEQRPRPAPFTPLLWGSDLNRRQIQRAVQNSQRAEVAEWCQWHSLGINDVGPAVQEWLREEMSKQKESDNTRYDALSNRKGILLMNPPYGHRLNQDGELYEFFARCGEVLKESFKGFEAWMIIADDAPWKALKMKPNQRLPFRNGSIDCHVYCFPIHT